MTIQNHGNLVVDTLEYYRERTDSNGLDTPKAYLLIQERLTRVKDEGKKVLIDIKDSYSVQTVVVTFEYVHNRWALGKSICYFNNEEVEVPYTLHYSDILCKRLKVKMIEEGDNPFEQKS